MSRLLNLGGQAHTLTFSLSRDLSSWSSEHKSWGITCASDAPSSEGCLATSNRCSAKVNARDVYMDPKQQKQHKKKKQKACTCKACKNMLQETAQDKKRAGSGPKVPSRTSSAAQKLVCKMQCTLFHYPEMTDLLDPFA